MGGLRADGWWHLVGLRVNVFLFVWIACGRLVSFGGLRVDGYHCPCDILPVCLYAFSFFMLFISVAFIFSMDSDEGI